EDHARARRPQRLDGGEQGLRLQDHPAPAAALIVVGDAGPTPRLVSEIDHPDVTEPSRPRAAQDRLRDDRLHHPREERDDVDAHHRSPYSSSKPSGGRMTTRRASTSTSSTISGTAGIRCSRSAPRTTHRSWPGAGSIPLNSPTTRPSSVDTWQPI